MAEPVATEKNEKMADALNTETTQESPIRIAVGAMITPKEGFIYYRAFLDYIGKKLSREIKFVDRQNYAEINQLLKNKLVDVAFVCSGPYVDGHNDFGLELLAAPQAYGKTEYYSYIIASKDSPINSFEDLKGKTFAFTDPLSNTGTLVPTYMLAKMGETPDSFFKETINTYGHDKSIKAVADKIVDAAAVDSLIWEYANHANPEFTSKTKVIKVSAPYGIPPIVIRAETEPVLKEKIRQIFLNADKDAEGKAILDKMMIDKFVSIDDRAYDSIREMKSWTENKNQGK